MVNHTMVKLCIAYLSGTLDESQTESFQHLVPEERRPHSWQGDQSSISTVSATTYPLVFFLLQDELCWALACDLAEHVIPIMTQRIGQDQRPHEIVRSRRLWLRGSANDEMLKRANTLAYELMADATLDGSALAVAGSLFNCVSMNRKSSVAAESAAEHAIAAVRLYNLREEAIGEWSEASELRWQIGHIRQVLTQALPHHNIAEYLKLYVPLK
jgi:hypothetical protein